MASQIDIITQIFEQAWNRQDFSNLRDFIAENAVIHLGGATASASPVETIQFIKRWKLAFPDLKFDIQDILVQDKKVAVRAVMLGTHQNSWRGFEATNQKISVPHMFFFRFSIGKIVEIWEVADFSRTMKQLQSVVSK